MSKQNKRQNPSTTNQCPNGSQNKNPQPNTQSKNPNSAQDYPVWPAVPTYGLGKQKDVPQHVLLCFAFSRPSTGRARAPRAPLRCRAERF